ncbi:MAG TPA: ATPase, T2SS/T4P/T4SS family [Pirellulales bacterium]|jgi:type II secretory ATPase GspE/PulE/Tfp pilus assembly ATPase PilB-like protein|nr:ATPase, T2SS/T4P/T4SS family [Pirellulales bacterium]
MARIALIIFAAAALGVCAETPVLAQTSGENWPANLDQLMNLNDPAKFPRGTGGYFGIVKLVLCVGVFVGWVRSTDWINTDAIRRKGAFARWNMIATFAFLGAALVAWLIDVSILLTLPVLLAGWIAPLAVYVVQRNKEADLGDQVFTPDHVRGLLAPHLKRIGIKLPTAAPGQPRRTKNSPPPLDYKAQGAAAEIENQANLLKAKQSPGFNETGNLLLDVLAKRATGVMLDFTREATAVRYQIDSIWTDVGTRDRPTGDAMLVVVKTLAALKPEERAARQKGTFGIQKEKQKFQCRVVSMGTKTGERAIVQIDDGRARKSKLADIGMREKLQNDLKTVLGEKQGFVVVSAPPSGGMTTILSATASAVDRFMRNAAGLEDATNKDLEVENVPIKTYGPGESAAEMLAQLVRTYPDVIVVPELNDPKVVGILCDSVAEDRLIIGGIRARDAAESLLRVLALKVPMKQFVPVVSAAVNQRLVRKLCDSCKEAYTPTPQMIQQLRLPADKVTSFYRPPQPTPDDPKPKLCPDCNSTGYCGVTGLFEVLVVNDGVRRALLTKPTVESVRQAAQKAGMRTLQEEGILMVAQGITSLPELKRALTEKE